VAVLHERLAAYRGHHIVNGRYAMAYAGPAELHLGIASAHLGLLDDAVDDLEGALKACFANNAEGFRAETQHRLASILVRRSAPGDIARARTLTVDAARVAGELGMPALRHSAADLLGRIDNHPSMALTRREHEVAILVAEGMTNRDVAKRLYLSERTAQNHVQHILDKLNLRNRSQIGGWLRESEMSRAPE
jgi:DNA-binding NarL/FixJ family response regulator